MLYDLIFDNKEKTVKVTDGVLKGVLFKELASEHELYVPSCGCWMSHTSQALRFQDYIDTTLTFRAFVQKCLDETSDKYGVKKTLKMTGMSRASYYRGMQAKHQRSDSEFNKYLKSLEPIESVFNALHNARANVKEN